MDNSPFALLPRELRDLIWTYSLAHDGLTYHTGGWKLGSGSDIAYALNLRRACKQICNESTKSFLAANSTITLRHKLFTKDKWGARSHQRDWVDAVERIPRWLGLKQAKVQLRLQFVDLHLSPNSAPALLAPVRIGKDLSRVCDYVRGKDLSLEITLYYHIAGETMANGFKRPTTYGFFTCTFSADTYDNTMAKIEAAYQEKVQTLESLYGAAWIFQHTEISLQHCRCAKELMEDMMDCFVAREEMNDLAQCLEVLDLEA